MSETLPFVIHGTSGGIGSAVCLRLAKQGSTVVAAARRTHRGHKAYIASGKYIDRMSNYCQTCRFDPGVSTGDEACLFTNLYWNFIRCHQTILEANGRTALQVRDYRREGAAEREAIVQYTSRVRELIAGGDL